MKRYLKGIVTIVLAMVMSIGGVEAYTTETRKIDSSACETIYTNYYFFLDANTVDYFKDKNLSDITHTTIAEYYNNSYLTNSFDRTNIGYGQVNVSRTSTTSRDGIKSMSLDDYYAIYLKSSIYGGAYSDGTSNYIVSHGWYSVSASGDATKKTGGLDLSNYTIGTLKAATLDANSVLSLRSTVSTTALNPFQIQVSRTYTGSLTGTPLHNGSYDWYIHPAVYYIQYCDEKEDEYTVYYDGNGSNVTNVPKDQTSVVSECVTISNKIPKKSGYTFLGWSLKEDATVASSKYAPGEEYCGGKGDIILYAVWEKDDDEDNEPTTPVTPSETYYHIYYRAKLNDVVVNLPQDATINSESDTYISSVIPVREGYTFLGWSSDISSTVADPYFASGSHYTDRKDIVLYAIWKKNSNPTLPDNPQTGITDYLLPFGGAVSVSGLGLGILKKRKSFKQF